ncbi:MAG: GntR family transcriptional regulator [Eubacterium sp.]|nr:GntR family transcriptional regulator [Eubacterium sp.]
MLGLKPIQLLPARERVASELRKAILSRQVSEGEVLALETTAQELGVSVTPVREAFQILARDGLIDLKQNKGAVVLGINEKTIREHYQVRAALESAACVLCCENASDLSAVRNCLDQADRALAGRDSGNYANYNQSFHYEIWKAAGNEKLQRMLAELWNGLSMGLKSTEEEYANISQEEHRKICRAMEERDVDSSGKQMMKHIYRSMEDVLTRYQ